MILGMGGFFSSESRELTTRVQNYREERRRREIMVANRLINRR